MTKSILLFLQPPSEVLLQADVAPQSGAHCGANTPMPPPSRSWVGCNRAR
ncbi:hypothetical protein JM951_01400 [Xanthomonas fragariae]|nr:hypothetical protein [Xanthomonas fragariae]MBL9220124.1 hypothetical protein [Xanthomonas fragariae]